MPDWTTLPDEILQRIFEKLCSTETQLQYLATVCKRFSRLTNTGINVVNSSNITSLRRYVLSDWLFRCGSCLSGMVLAADHEGGPNSSAVDAGLLIQQLVHLPKLQSLDLVGFKVPITPPAIPGRNAVPLSPPAGCTVLARITQLTSQTLRNCSMPEKDLCGGLAALTNLQFLQLSGPYMLPEVLQRLTQLTFLDITCHNFVYIQTSQGVATTIARHSCMHLSALQRLTVLKIAFAKAGGRLTDADRQAVLAQIQQLPVLQHLDLTMAPTKALIYEPGLDETLSELTNLESLQVRSGKLYPGCSLGGLTKLTSLTLDTCMFPANLQLDTRNLQRLRLHQANIQSPTKVVPTGQAAGPSPSAQQEVTPAAVPDLLAAIGKMTRLTYLALEQCQGTGYDLASWPANSFAALTASSSLQELHFTCLDKQVHTDLARRLYVMMFVTAPAAVAVPGVGLLQPQVLVLSSNIQQMIKVPEANIWEHVFPANKPLPALRVLKLHVPCRTFFGSTLANIVANCPSLRSVDLQGMVTQTDPVELIFTLPHIQSLMVDCLHIGALWGNGRVHTTALSTRLEHLHIINAHEGLDAMSEAGLMQLTALKSLRSLKVDRVLGRPQYNRTKVQQCGCYELQDKDTPEVGHAPRVWIKLLKYCQQELEAYSACAIYMDPHLAAANARLPASLAELSAYLHSPAGIEADATAEARKCFRRGAAEREAAEANRRAAEAALKAEEAAAREAAKAEAARRLCEAEQNGGSSRCMQLVTVTAFRPPP